MVIHGYEKSKIGTKILQLRHQVMEKRFEKSLILYIGTLGYRGIHTVYIIVLEVEVSISSTVEFWMLFLLLFPLLVYMHIFPKACQLLR